MYLMQGSDNTGWFLKRFFEKHFKNKSNLSGSDPELYENSGSGNKGPDTKQFLTAG
jgi:hypothetical protein